LYHEVVPSSKPFSHDEIIQLYDRNTKAFFSILLGLGLAVWGEGAGEHQYPNHTFQPATGRFGDGGFFGAQFPEYCCYAVHRAVAHKFVDLS
jgi:hypothetical protein